MPYFTKKGTGKDKGKTCVYKKDGGKKVGCTTGPVGKYLGALHANANEEIDKQEKLKSILKEIINEILKEELK